MRPDLSTRDGHAFDVEERGLRQGASVEPCLMVIFGAAGDLARRELVPSLFELHRKQLLPEHFAVVGVSLALLTAPHTGKRTRRRLVRAVSAARTAAGDRWGDLALQVQRAGRKRVRL